MTRHPWAPSIARHRRTSDALARATGTPPVSQGMQRPSLWERDLRLAPADRECLRCGVEVEPDRDVMCLPCLDNLRSAQ